MTTEEFNCPAEDPPACPECEQISGELFSEGHLWGFCTTHNAKWVDMSNDWHGPLDMTQEDRNRNVVFLSGFQDVTGRREDIGRERQARVDAEYAQMIETHIREVRNKWGEQTVAGLLEAVLRDADGYQARRARNMNAPLWNYTTARNAIALAVDRLTDNGPAYDPDIPF